MFNRAMGTSSIFNSMALSLMKQTISIICTRQVSLWGRMEIIR